MCRVGVGSTADWFARELSITSEPSVRACEWTSRACDQALIADEYLHQQKAWFTLQFDALQVQYNFHENHNSLKSQQFTNNPFEAFKNNVVFNLALISLNWLCEGQVILRFNRTFTSVLYIIVKSY